MDGTTFWALGGGLPALVDIVPPSSLQILLFLGVDFYLDRFWGGPRVDLYSGMDEQGGGGPLLGRVKM